MENRDQVNWQRRARQALAGGVSSQFRAADPVVFSHGKGSRIWDIDGNEFIDYTLSQGPLIHGHSHPEVLREVVAALGRGQIWNGLHAHEIELAEKLIEIIPCADSVRLGCTATEAVQAAIRLARAFTRRPKIVKFEGHYHGWLDSVAASINPSLEAAGPDDSPHSVPWCDGIAPHALESVVVAPWNDLSIVSEIIGRNAREIAAVITEPCMCNSGCIEPTAGYLVGLRDLCDRHGILLIFDEVITGFRLSLGGAQQYYGVTADLAVFGKAVASGFPLSVIAGPADKMQLLADGRAIHAGTLNAHVGCVAAALASVRLLEQDKTIYSRLHELGRKLMGRLKESASSAGLHVVTTGPGAVFHMGFVQSGIRSGHDPIAVRNYRDVVRTYDTAAYARFVREMASHGVRLIGRGIWYLSTAHTEADLDQTVDAAGKSFERMATIGQGGPNLQD